MTQTPQDTPEPLDPSSRLAEMEAAMTALNEIVGRLPSQEDADRAVRVERQVNRMMGFALLPTLLTLALVAFAALGTFRAKDAAERNINSTRCILGQLAEHRVANQELNEAIAQALGVAVPTHPSIAPPPVLDQLIQACDDFYDNGPSLRR